MNFLVAVIALLAGSFAIVEKPKPNIQDKKSWTGKH